MSDKIAVIDYGVGNIHSVLNALNAVQADGVLVSEPDELFKFKKAILPGVGAFAQAMHKLKQSNMDNALKEYIKGDVKLLGICLGMQLLFERGHEFGLHDGLGIIKGEVIGFDLKKFKSPCKIPHMGWNLIEFTRQNDITKDMSLSEYFYFVHSYHVVCDDDVVLGRSEYGYSFVSAICDKNIYGFQPHPEKSSKSGLCVLRNFKELV